MLFLSFTSAICSIGIVLFYSSSVRAQNATEHYDFIVIGGGSAGLAAAKEAAKHNKDYETRKICVLDYVSPSPRGTVWGMGGTCVNVGCIPKKLFHEAALLRKSISDSLAYGWEMPNLQMNDNTVISNNWVKLVETVSNYIASTRWKLKRDLKMLNITYKNALGSFVDPHVIKASELIPGEKDENGKQKFNETYIEGKFILIATGMRPRLFDNPRLNKYVITSDDLFTLKKPPGKTLIVGAGYIALECAGILQELGFNTTVIVRNQLLRKFDQDMVQILRSDLKSRGVKFCLHCEVRNITLKSETPEGLQTLAVEVFDKLTSRKHVAEFNTVLVAIGRAPILDQLNLDVTNVKYNIKTGKIQAWDERTSVPHIFAAGDVIEGPPELTPVAIKAGQIVGRRLFAKSRERMEYGHVPTTVFTPLEYGYVGLSEEDATQIFGENEIDVYHAYFYPLEWEISRPQDAGDNSKCFLKVVCLRQSGRIMGFHYTGPHAGDIIQGFAVAMKTSVNIRQLQKTVGIHPTIAEEYTRISITKRSGQNPRQLSCCS